MKPLRTLCALAALSFAVPAAYADVCVAPGEMVLEDPSGDTAFQDVIPVPGGTFYDLVALSVAASPLVKGEDRKLTFTIDLTAQQPLPAMLPGSAIFASFLDTRRVVRGVRVQSDNMGGMSFFSYLAGPSSSAGGAAVTDGRFIVADSEVPAQPESSYAGGVATIVVKFKDIKLDEDGGVLNGFNAATTQAASVPGVGGVAGTVDTMPDGLVHINSLEIGKCSGKSAEAKAASEVEDKSSTNFGGAFGLLNLLLMLPMLAIRRGLGVAALMFVAPMAWADVCVAPGDVVIEDASGDNTGGPATSFFDLQAVSVATPPADSMDDQTVVFTIDTAGTAPGFPPGSSIYTSFLDPRGTVRGVRMEGDMSGGLIYYTYVGSPDTNDVVDGRFVEDGSQKPAEGSYSGGTITITAKAKDVGIRNKGDELRGFNAAVSLLIGTNGAGFSSSPDSMPSPVADREASATITYVPCKKSVESRAAVVEDKSGTNFGGALAPVLLMLLGWVGLRRPRS